MAELTPMMRQYFEIKNAYQEYILFYRLGDFYEMFFEDAKLVSRELELTLTGRDCGQEERAPMCGVPYHSAEGYIARLVKKGYKVAICEQVEDPKSAKGLVKREIVRIITPGTVLEASMLVDGQNNFLASVQANEEGMAVCFADISTGEILATFLPGDTASKDMMSELARFMPREVLLPAGAPTLSEVETFLKERLACNLEHVKAEEWDEGRCKTHIYRQFPEMQWDKVGLTQYPAVVQCVGVLLWYLKHTQKASLASLQPLQMYQTGQFMELDFTTRRNLELCETMRGKEKKGSLLWVMDQTQTAMGSRLIRQWLEKPLRNPILIRKRQDAVGKLMDAMLIRHTLIEGLQKVFDMERLITRVVYGSAGARDLRALWATMGQLPTIHGAMQAFSSGLLQELASQIDLLGDVQACIDRAIIEEPPLSVREGGIIRVGYHEQIDTLRELASGGKGKIAEIEQREREKTGIKTLKVGYNRVFGYYIEVSRQNSNSVPAEYIRKQTLANCERFITQELKEYENMVLSAQDKLVALEYELFLEVRQTVAQAVHRIQKTAQALAQIDVLCSLATVAHANNYTCPDVDFSDRLEIIEGRHPVVEKMVQDRAFVPNDTLLDCKENRCILLTGPNMAGKSTYMRQVALIAVLAQMGSFVPAKRASLGVVDRVFTRVGASDDVASGQSTFMVEMVEVADILQNATKNSLLILDEIGRGTSTYDGMSIARAVVEYVVNSKKLGAKTLFATHYHELTVLEELLDGVRNYHIVAKKRGEDIIFLRKIVRGGADDSYGIEVAKLAGVPSVVIRRAKEILKDLEAGGTKIEVRTSEGERDAQQLHLGEVQEHPLLTELRQLHVDTMTPIEALNTLCLLKKKLE